MLLLSRDEELIKERKELAVPLVRNPFEQRAAIEEKATSIDLLFDLAFAACLTVFAESHSASSGENVGAYVAFIVLLNWAYTSVVIFDCRFQRIDILNRMLKFCQLAVFGLLGAYALSFSPTAFVPADIEQILIASHSESEEPTSAEWKSAPSWRGICITFALSRLFVCVQYLLLLTQGAWFCAARSVFLLAGGAALSAGVALGVEGMTAETGHQNALRFGLLYGAIAADMLLTLMASWSHSLAPTTNAPLLADRIRLVLLILLGEGFVGLVRSTGIMEGQYGFSSATWIQALSAFALFFLAWVVLFDFLAPNSRMSSFRTHLWTLLHLPEEIALLLWLEGIVVVLVFTNFSTALRRLNLALSSILSASADFVTMYGANISNDNPLIWQLNPSNTYQVGQTLDLLGTSLVDVNLTLVTASYEVDDQLQYLASTANMTSAMIIDQRSQLLNNATIQLVGSLLSRLLNVFDLDPDSELQHLILSDFSRSDGAAFAGLTTDDFNELQAQIEMTVAPAALFVLPCAGGLLLVSAVLAVMQRSRPPDIYGYLLLVPRVLVGTTLCLLALLDLGRDTITGSDFDDSTNAYQSWSAQGFSPALRLLHSGWLLPMQVFLFAFVAIYELLGAYWAQHAYKRSEIAPNDAQPDEQAMMGDGKGDDSETNVLAA